MGVAEALARIVVVSLVAGLLAVAATFVRALWHAVARMAKGDDTASSSAAEGYVDVRIHNLHKDNLDGTSSIVHRLVWRTVATCTCDVCRVIGQYADECTTELVLTNVRSGCDCYVCRQFGVRRSG